MSEADTTSEASHKCGALASYSHWMAYIDSSLSESNTVSLSYAYLLAFLGLFGKSQRKLPPLKNTVDPLGSSPACAIACTSPRECAKMTGRTGGEVVALMPWTSEGWKDPTAVTVRA